MHLGLGSDLDSCDKGDGVEDSLGVLLQFCYSGFDMAIRFGTELPTIFRLSMVCGAWGLCGRVGKFERSPFLLQAPLSRGVSVGHEIRLLCSRVQPPVVHLSGPVVFSTFASPAQPPRYHYCRLDLSFQDDNALQLLRPYSAYRRSMPLCI
jgi:hypothetical protein